MNDEKVISIMDLIQERKEKEFEVSPIIDFEDFHWRALTSILPYCIVKKQQNDYHVDYKTVAVSFDESLTPLPKEEIVTPLFILKPIHEDTDLHYGFDLYAQSNLANTFLYILQYLHPNMCWHCILNQYDKVSEEKRLIDMYVKSYIERADDV